MNGTAYEVDKHFSDQFRSDLSRIIVDALQASVSVAPPEDDWKYNTDYGLTIDVPTVLKDGGVWRISARTRRAAEKTKRSRTGHPYSHEFTIRYSRPSGVGTERAKMLAGHGALMIYGFQAEPNATHMDPWVMIALDHLRAWDPKGTKHRDVHENKDGSSKLAVYWLEDVPRECVLRSSGIPTQIIGSIARSATDPRYQPYTKADGWAEATAVHPDNSQPTGWCCPGCKQNAATFFGQGPRFDPLRRRYEGPDHRLCLDCWRQAA